MCGLDVLSNYRPRGGPCDPVALPEISFNIAYTVPSRDAAKSWRNILAGRSYINFHTIQFPAGEIRGALIAPIPEPETYALMLGGLAALGWMGRRRKQRRTG